MDKEIQQGLFTCERNLDYFIPHRQISVSLCFFVYLSLLSLSMLLFKIFNFRFHVFLDWPFLDMRFCDSRYLAQRSCVVGLKVVFIYAEYFLFFSFQVTQHLQYDFPGLLFAEIFSWLKILMVELIVKNFTGQSISNISDTYTRSFLSYYF